MHQPDRITTAEVMRRINAHERLIFIDVRTAEDWSASEEMIGGAMRVPPEAVEQQAGRMPRNPLVLYCSTPHEATSMAVARELIGRGFGEVRVLAGGLEAWKQAKGFVTAKPGEGVREMKTERPTRPSQDLGRVSDSANVPREGVGAGTVVRTPMADLPSPHHRPGR